MIDINLWKELTVFEKCGTLSKAAENLFISQPALEAATITSFPDRSFSFKNFFITGVIPYHHVPVIKTIFE